MFSDCFLDFTGGIVTTMRAEKAALEARGHTVYIFSSAYPRGQKTKQVLATQHIFPVKSCRFFGRSVIPIARRPKIVMKELEKAHPELKDFNIFYIHYEAGCSIAGLKLAQKYHIPSVQVMHGREDVGEEKLIPHPFKTFVAVMLNWFHSWYLPHPIKIKKDNYLATTIARAKMWTLMVNHANAADFVITPSEHFRQKLLHYGVKKPIQALHHGISDELVAAKITPRPLKQGEPLEIIWHSRLSGEKRILPFLEALSQVEAKYHLSAYGSGVAEKQAKKYAKQHHLNVTFHGDADFKTIWQAISKSHLDVLVSYDYDTFGMTLVEAAAAGVPSLIADPDLAEVLPENTYFLTDNPSPSAIAKTLDSIYAHPERVSEASQKLLSDRSYLKISAKIDALEKLFANLQKFTKKS